MVPNKNLFIYIRSVAFASQTFPFDVPEPGKFERYVCKIKLHDKSHLFHSHLRHISYVFFTTQHLIV
jgi:hypothetical protein